MASQSVLIPNNSSLFITDRSWLRPEKAPKPGQSTFRLGESSVMNGLSVSVVKTSIKPSKVQDEESRKVAENRGLQFVNAMPDKRGKKDVADLRRLVRSHVMTGTKRETKRSAKAGKKEIETPAALIDIRPQDEDDATEELLSHHSCESWPSSTSSHMTLIPSGMSTPLYATTSFKIQPQFHRFLNYYIIQTASDMYPLQAFFAFNPVKSFWFPVALTDEVLLHTIMYSAAFGLAQADPERRASDMMRLAGPILRLLTDRLAGKTPVNDATIGAVSCLVMVENLSNDQEKRRLHMNGLQQMIKSRGGLENVDQGLVMKIIRADIEGSVDNLTRPVLPPLKRVAPTLYSTLPPHARLPPSETFQELLRTSELRGEMKDTLLELSNFTTAVEYYTTQSDKHSTAINPRSFDEDLLSVTRDLLEMDHLTVIESVLQIAALIFAKSIGRGLPFALGSNSAASGSRLLPKRLRQALQMAINADLMTFSTDVLLWLLTIGGLASAQDLLEHSWFVDKLVKIYVVNAMEMFREVLFVGMVHEQACRRLFEKVDLLRRLKTYGIDM
jgi:Fungal specific transcription factor domain